jgi:hypothetical protein
MKDVTIVHDKSHPNYDAKLDVSYSKSTATIHHRHDLDSSVFKADSGGDLMGSLAKKRRMGSPNDAALYLASASKSDDTGRPSSFNQSWPVSSLEANRSLGSSWHGSSSTQTPKEKKVDLTALSPSTLKLLNQGNLSKFINKPASPQLGGAEDELKLTQIVDRLNNAAAKNTRKSSRDGSVDGSRHSRESKCLVPFQILIKLCEFLIMIMYFCNVINSSLRLN